MKKKPLKETNPYLKDPLLREDLSLRSVISSSAVEGIRPSKEELARLKELVEAHQSIQSINFKK